MLLEMIRLIDDAVEKQTTTGCCKAVKRALEDIVNSGQDFVPGEFLKPAEGSYARRLLHRDPENRYTILVMVWGVGQGTSLHDHAGMWCVECVYRGSILVKSYSLEDEVNDRFRFERREEVVAGIGDAGALIPPFDYHTIENAETDRPSVTLHVYGGEMNWCHAFVPAGDYHKMERRELIYTE
jgi:predicted metal-dependent enzyme (double-stranded beta helix superfamily)